MSQHSKTPTPPMKRSIGERVLFFLMTASAIVLMFLIFQRLVSEDPSSSPTPTPPRSPEPGRDADGRTTQAPSDRRSQFRIDRPRHLEVVPLGEPLICSGRLELQPYDSLAFEKLVIESYVTLRGVELLHNTTVLKPKVGADGAFTFETPLEPFDNRPGRYRVRVHALLKRSEGAVDPGFPLLESSQSYQRTRK